MEKNADVIIIGAGVTGCSIAWHLGLLGIRDVLLIEKLPGAGQGSTAKANGGIRAQWSTPVNIRQSLYSISAYERFQEDTGGDCGLVQAGYLFMTATEEGEQSLRSSFDLQQQLGVPNSWLERKEIAALAPFVRSDDLRGGTFSPKDGFIDPHGTVQGYLQAALRQGARLLAGTEALEVTREAGRATGIATAGETLFAGSVVNAAGPFAGIVT